MLKDRVTLASEKIENYHLIFKKTFTYVNVFNLNGSVNKVRAIYNTKIDLIDTKLYYIYIPQVFGQHVYYQKQF